MSEEIRVGSGAESVAHTVARRLVPMQIGNAIVYIEELHTDVEVVVDESIHPVAPPSPTQVFENAGQILHECVRTVGERVGALADALSPNEVEIEFTLSFEAKGKANVIPIFVTGESGIETGLKVTAVWKKPEKNE
jgi:Trypsin-co-occurring domain 1